MVIGGGTCPSEGLEGHWGEALTHQRESRVIGRGEALTHQTIWSSGVAPGRCRESVRSLPSSQTAGSSDLRELRGGREKGGRACG